ncbi:hypothetical protein Dimus_001564, partial [Dionaea muscipula]
MMTCPKMFSRRCTTRQRAHLETCSLRGVLSPRRSSAMLDDVLARRGLGRRSRLGVNPAEKRKPRMTMTIEDSRSGDDSGSATVLGGRPRRSCRVWTEMVMLPDNVKRIRMAAV